MLGKPKYKYMESVVFTLHKDGVDIQLQGYIYIIDEYGTFFDNSDVSYDIMVKDSERGDILYKHVREDKVLYSLDKYKNK